MFKGISIGSRLFLLLGTLSILIAFVGGAGIHGMKKVYDNQKETTSIYVPAMNYLRAADVDLFQALLASCLFIHLDPESKRFSEHLQTFQKNVKQSEERFEGYLTLIPSAKDDSLVEVYQEVRGKWLQVSEQLIEKIEVRESAIDLEKQVNATFEVMEDHLDAIADNCMVMIEKETQLSLHAFRGTRIVVIAIILISIFLGLFLGYLIVKSIVNPLKEMVLFAEKVGEGDLSQSLNLNSSDEIGLLGHSFDAMIANLYQKASLAEDIAKGDLTVAVDLASEEDSLGYSLTHMVENLNHTIKSIHGNSVEVANRSVSLSQSSDQLSDGATKQASALEEITSLMAEVDVETQRNIEHAVEVNTLISFAQKAANEGNQKMGDMTSAMTEINHSSEQVKRVVKVIEDIAFQTNLLALNAAVESARAGVHGKGFAVVAEEVRSLATRSAKAAQETTELIETSASRVKNGTDIVHKTASSLGEIEKKVAQVTTFVDKIVQSSKQQGAGVKEVAQGLDEIGAVTMETASSAQHTATASNELSQFSQELQNLVDYFQLKEGRVQVEREDLPLLAE